jgi:16S rRNA (guanine966-N2)-methyltransferase
VRVIRGKFAGKAILSPNSKLTRPTTDKVRQAVFNVLEHNVSMPEIDGLVVLDSFAGTGALGLEALSRGAAHVTFVEKQRQASLNIMRLAHEWGIKERVDVVNKDIFSVVEDNAPYNLVFCDPPYGQGLVAETIQHLVAYNMMAPDALIIAEMHKRDMLPALNMVEVICEKMYGDIKVLFLKLTT